MSEDQIIRSTAAAKAARRAAIAVAPVPEPLASEPTAPEPIAAEPLVAAAEEVLEAAAEPATELAEVPAEALPAEFEAVAETAAEAAVEIAETVTEVVVAEAVMVQTLAADALEAVAEAVMAPVAEAVEATPSAPEVAAPEIVAAGSAFAAKAALRIQALSDASTALSLGAQEASRTWLAATQSGMKLQRESFRKLAACRTPLDLMTAQGEFALRGLETVTETGEAIARMSTKAIESAGKALQV